MTSISVDIGGSRMKSALVTEGLLRHEMLTPMASQSGLGVHLPAVEREIARLLGKASAHAIGIAFPGIVDPVQKRVLSTNGKYNDALGFDWEGWAKQKFGLPLILDNDANAALLGEIAFGCGKGFDDAVIMILGTGIGTAALIHGRLLRGRHFQAGCLGGHISTQSLARGRACTCGSVGCAEASGGGWAMAMAVREDPGFALSGLSGEETTDFRALKKWDDAQDALAVRMMDLCIDSWSTCAVNLIHAYDPSLLILSGGVIHCGERIIRPISENVRRYAWTPWGEVEVRVSRHPEHSVLLGLHALAAQALEQTPAQK